MKKYTDEEFRELIAQKIISGELDPETDSEGQLVFYTGMFENAVSDIQDEADPEYDEVATLDLDEEDDEEEELCFS